MGQKDRQGCLRADEALSLFDATHGRSTGSELMVGQWRMMLCEDAGFNRKFVLAFCAEGRRGAMLGLDSGLHIDRALPLEIKMLRQRDVEV